MSHTLFLSAGESSGDLHGASLARAILERAPETAIVALGGPRMAEAGAEVVRDLTAHSAVGISEAIRSFSAFRGGLREAVALLDERRPDAVVLIDSPELNLRLARQAHQRGIRVVYYICPQVWAWRQGRVRTIARYVDRLLCILPFEPRFFAQHGIDATFVGHPLIDILAGHRRDRRLAARIGLPDDLPIIGILPGSRRGEIARLLPTLLDAGHRILRNLDAVTLAVAPAPSVPAEEYTTWPSRTPDPIHIVAGHTHELMAAADLLLVASGTATLEAGIIGTPMIVTYKVSPLTWLIARLLVRGVKYCSLVNLIANRELVPELLQSGATADRIARRAVSFFRDGGLQETAAALAAEVRPRLGPPGASARAADAILDLLGSG